MKIYVAIPYTRHEKLSFAMANHASYEIIKMGHIPFSPISMSHPIVEASKNDGNYDKELLGTWAVWSKIDYSYIDWCDELWVVNLDKDAVETSTGVQAEIEYAIGLGKNIRTIDVKYKGKDKYQSATVAMNNGANRDTVDYLDDKIWEYKLKFPKIKDIRSKNSRLLAQKIVEEVDVHSNNYDLQDAIEKILD
jgi:nucleoside 2-deoxyribosyltransferase